MNDKCKSCGKPTDDAITDESIEAMVGIVETAERVAAYLDLSSAHEGMRHMMATMKAVGEQEKVGDRPDPFAGLVRITGRRDH